MAETIRSNSTLQHINLSNNNLGGYEATQMGVQWTSMPVIAGQDFFFEVEANHVASGCTCIGLAHKAYDMTCNQVGWRQNSYGYHSDDGFFYLSQPSAENSAKGQPTWSAGDRVGCGFESSSSSIYFTHNGSRVGKAVPVQLNKPLFPTITSGSSSEPPALKLLTAPMSMKLPERGMCEFKEGIVSLHRDSAAQSLAKALAENCTMTVVSVSCVNE